MDGSVSSLTLAPVLTKNDPSYGNDDKDTNNNNMTQSVHDRRNTIIGPGHQHLSNSINKVEQESCNRTFSLLSTLNYRRRPSLPTPTHLPFIIQMGTPSTPSSSKIQGGKRRSSNSGLLINTSNSSNPQADSLTDPSLCPGAGPISSKNPPSNITIVNPPAASVAPIKAILADDPKAQKKKSLGNLASGGPSNASGASIKPVGLFSHLVQYECPVDRPIPATVHPAIVKFALRSASYLNLGSSNRCQEMLSAFREALKDYRANPEMAICRHLDLWVKPMIGFIVEARPMAVPMANAVRALRHQISLLPPEMNESEAQETMIRFIDTFLLNRLDMAQQLIVQYALAKITNEDVILTFGKSRAVTQLLLTAAAAVKEGGPQFRVIVVDGRPFSEGKTLLSELVAAGIPCDLVNISSLAYVMKEVKKTIVGAAGLYANGTMLSRVGTAMVCTLSRRANVPVIVACETVKFSDRSQIDSFVFNELGNPDALLEGVNRPIDEFNMMMNHNSSLFHDQANPNGNNGKGYLRGWKEIPSLKLLNILYDVTPAEYITMVITEIGMIPVTSIPVVLREYTTSSAILGHHHHGYIHGHHHSHHSHHHHHHHHHHSHHHSHHHQHNNNNNSHGHTGHPRHYISIVNSRPNQAASSSAIS